MRAYIITDSQVRVASKRQVTPGKGQLVITSAEELGKARLNTKRLMTIWNALPGVKKVTKVAGRQKILEQLWIGFESLPTPTAKKSSKEETASDPRASKQGRVVEMLHRPEGATIDEIVAATKWQPHTVRGVISGALKKKLGLAVASAKEERGRVYRIA
jgi:hypothetical protein